MSISSTDRKLLWSRAHNRCALCRAALTQPADGIEIPGLVTGQEAHIVARSPLGPRGELRGGVEIDSYDNLMLLCPEDHLRIDAQPLRFPVDRLHQLKREHEQWAEQEHDSAAPDPIRILKAENEESILFSPLTTGAEVWAITAHAHQWGLMTLDDTHPDEQVDAADQFLTTAQSWGEMADDVEMRGLSSVRSVQRSLNEALQDLWQAGVYVWGRRLQRTITGGIGAPAPWTLAELVTRTPGDFEPEDFPDPASSHPDHP